jgi:hypothetical protein
MSFFTYLWKTSEWKKKIQMIKSGDSKISYAAGSKFKESGMRIGDTVFIVSVQNGDLYLAGKIKIAKITNKTDAANILSINESELWTSDEYLIPDAKDIDIFRQNLIIDINEAKELDFCKDKGFVKLKYNDNKIDPQTLRRPRKLYSPSELILFNAIKNY